MNRDWSVSAAWVLGLAGLFVLVTEKLGAGEPVSSDQVTLIVRETAGIRRFGYPVQALVPLSGSLAKAKHFQLLEKGKPVAAQFQPRGDQSVDLDFDVSLGPHETREYTIEAAELEKSSRNEGGIQIVETPNTTTRDLGIARWTVRHGRELEFVVPKNLKGLLEQVRTPQLKYLRAGATGLQIRPLRAFGEGKVRPPFAFGRGSEVRVTKSGPLTGSLRLESVETLFGGQKVRSLVDLDFPVSKSWVQVRWTIDDPKGDITSLGTDLNLNLEGEPTLVDFGAGTYVYAQLREGEAATLKAGSLVRKRSQPFPPWEVLTGRAPDLTPYVTASRQSASPAEGWAHIMDRQRCTALAVEGFSEFGQEAEITVHADGRLQIWKHFARGDSPARPGPKKLTFWLHFVPMPVHVGAATSPQAMLAPLAVEIRQPKK
jgi:hypothetical protein